MEENQTQNRAPLRRPVQPIPQQQEEKKQRIKTWMAVCMIITALSVDAFQALLTAVAIGVVLGPIIGVAAYFVFWIWFMLLGVSFIKSPKKLGAMGGAAIIEASLSFLPGFTAGITAVILMTMAEDKGGIMGKAVSMTQGKIKP